MNLRPLLRDLSAILGPEHRGALRAYLVWATVFGGLQGVAAALMVPVLRGLLAGEVGDALSWLAVMAVVVLATCVANYVQAMKGFAVAIVALTTMHERVGDHVSELPVGWFTGEKVGRLSRIVTSGTVMVGGLFAHLLTPLLAGAVTPVAIAAVTFFFDWRLAVAMLVCAPLLAWVFSWCARLVGRGDELSDTAAVSAANRVVEFARHQRTLRAFGRGSDGHRPLEDAITEQHRVGRKALWMAVPGILGGGLATQFAFTVLIVVGVLLALGGSVDPVALVAVLALAARFTGPLAELSELSGAVRMAHNDVRRITEVLREEPLPEPVATTIGERPGEIEFDHVDFGYDEDRPVLRDVTFTVPPRTMTALVGASGSGKTTVTRLIARFWDVDSGTVRVGGTDVRDQRTEDLVGQIAMVFQDVYLFDDTLEANILAGRPDATTEEVRAAGRLAGVEEIVGRLPDGWATRVGEGGTSLSGGERQRVSIARAIVKNAPVVLLDEATAALDTENERYVRAAMRALTERSTVLVIAHRLPTVVAADQIVVLDGGAVAQVGTHEELIVADGRYAAFWHERDRARGWRLAAG
ncbi:ABC transporter ATP-binding protein [Actinokineospora cianjurensis]|uniref:ATP-binding cassette subfamily B protein n=1 Tax=Actinokineospora cianjurensis TaxID=585224 RepID=A0A421B3T2_9PSEU|nr:ABC transporter ATP-binding protein [Actinokineospora cianjurensis]RLK58985.1 ATP-binding cassette subfamily B protein [Actinokineospora cianjurensis]